MHRPVKTWLGLVVIIIAAFIAGTLIWLNQKNPKASNPPAVNIPVPDQKACPMDAKLCPDGSAVGRTEPNCEFALCPEITGIADKIIITSPAENSMISSPITVSGKARGTWFFEGDFPVEVYDSNNKLLGQKYASFIPSPEEPEWMTENFVNFSGTIEFSKPTTDTGFILFKKDNPSDIRELDESYKLPVKFSSNSDTSDLAPSEVEGWQTYRNDNLDIVFGYPDNWTLLLENTYFDKNDFQIEFNTYGGDKISILGNNYPSPVKDYMQPYFGMCAQVNKGLKQFCDSIECININKKTKMLYESPMMGERVFMAYIYTELSKKYPYICVEATINQLHRVDKIGDYFREEYGDYNVSAFINSNEVNGSIKIYTNDLNKFAGSIKSRF